LKQRLGRRLWATLLTGIPFGVFKLATGWYFYGYVNSVLGVVFIAWGATDILLNILSLPLPRLVSYCLLSNIGRRIDVHTGGKSWEPILLGLDTLLSFLVVASMIWFRLLPLLPLGLRRMWDLAVVASVLGAGAERLWRAVQQAEES
jgi:hypothetical protein